MGCFLGCFGGPKDRKRRKVVRRSPPKFREIKAAEDSRLLLPICDHARLPPLIEISPLYSLPKLQSLTLPEEIPVPTSNSKTGRESEKSAFSSPKKKVTFDLNVTTYEPIHLSSDKENDSSIEACSKEKEEEKEKNAREESASAPENHRYHNCVTEDDYDFDDDSDEDEDEEEGDEENGEEESYDSYFSLQLDKEKQSTFDDVSSPAKALCPRDRSQYVHSVLNPVENRSQWKCVATKTGGAQLPKNLRKENIPIIEKAVEPQKIAIDASLSNWLPNNGSQFVVKDLCESPKSPIQMRQDENSSIKGIPNTTSKYREDRRVNWHSTPFEVRLERTLDRGDAEAY